MSKTKQLSKIASNINHIPLDILRFRAKTMPQIKEKQQGVAKLETLEENRVKVI